MNPLTLTLAEGRTSFHPGEALAGTLAWQFDKPAKSLELRLFWYTAGKGDMDVMVVDQVVIEHPAEQGQRDFTFVLPSFPFSFSGHLISLIWALEAVTTACDPLRVPFTLSPTGAEIVLANTGSSG